MKKIGLNIRVKSVAELSGNLEWVLQDTSGKIVLEEGFEDSYPLLKIPIDYPLGGLSGDVKYPPVIVEVKNPRFIGDIVAPICRAYKDVVYANEAKYGFWGHGIGDLVLEGLEIGDDGVCELHVGS